MLSAMRSLLGSLLALLPAPLASAQQQPPPAITLLFAQPTAIAPERLATAAAVALGPAAQVARRAGGVRLTHGETTVDVVDLGRQPVAESATAHLDDPDAVARLRCHGGAWKLELVAPLPAADARAAAYRPLGRLAAALLGDEVVGIGAGDHGTFEPIGEPTGRRLRGDDPLAALQPMQSSSVIVLLRAVRPWREADLRAAVKQGFGIELPASGDDPKAQEFAVASGPLAMVKVQGQQLLLTISRKRAFTGDEQAWEKRTRLAIDAHRAVLHIVTVGAPGATAERERYRALGRLLAGLWGDDCLAINWKTDRRLIAAYPALPERLRAEDPVAASLEDLPVPVVAQFDEAAMQRAIEEARRRWPEAAARHAKGLPLAAKFPFATRSGGHEHIWVTVTAIDGESVRGKLDNEPIDVAGLELGSEVTCQLADLSDWLFEQDGKLHGGFSLPVLSGAKGEVPDDAPPKGR